MSQIKTIGIDLGTTNTVIFSCESDPKSKNKYILNHIKISEQNVLPSVIFFETEDQLIFGSKAYNKGNLYPEARAYYYKTKMGETNENDRFFEIVPHKVENQIFMFDTNIYLDQIDILESHQHVEKNNKIILPNIILNELNHRKQLEPSCSESVDFILKQFEKYWGKNIIFENIDDKILSIRSELEKSNLFFNSNNDRNDLTIISWLFYHQAEDPIFVSSDKALLLKAKEIFKNTNVAILSYHEYLNYKDYNHQKKLKLDAKTLTSYFLKYVLSEANRLLNTSIENVIIGVPASFNSIQIAETKEAAMNAGFQNVDILSEPIAAAIAYCELDQQHLNQNQPIMIYDFGGGTFDFSMIEKLPNDQYKVIFNSGDELGGRRCTELFTQYLVDKIDDDYGICIEDDDLKMFYKKNLNTLIEASELAKIELSENLSTKINITLQTDKLQHLSFSISRNEFDDAIRSVTSNISKLMKKSLENHHILIDQLQNINFFLAGGSTFIPLVRKTLEREFKLHPKSTLNAANVIAQGAAIFAFYKYEKKQEIIKIDHLSHDIGVLVGKNEFFCLLDANTTVNANGLSVTKTFIKEDPNATSFSVVIFRREYGVKSKDVGAEGFQRIGILKIDSLPKLSKDQRLSIEIRFYISSENILDVKIKLIEALSQKELGQYKLDVKLGAI